MHLDIHCPAPPQLTWHVAGRPRPMCIYIARPAPKVFDLPPRPFLGPGPGSSQCPQPPGGQLCGHPGERCPPRSTYFLAPGPGSTFHVFPGPRPGSTFYVFPGPRPGSTLHVFPGPRAGQCSQPPGRQLAAQARLTAAARPPASCSPRLPAAARPAASCPTAAARSCPASSWLPNQGCRRGPTAQLPGLSD